MDADKIKDMKKEFPELQVFFEVYRPVDLQRTEVDIKVQRIDRAFLQRRFVDQHFPDTEKLWKLYVWMRNKSFSRIPPWYFCWDNLLYVPMRNLIKHYRTDEETSLDAFLLEGQPVYWALREELGRDLGRKVRRIMLTHVVRRKGELASVDIVILKIPGNLSFGRYLKRLLQKKGIEFLKEMSVR